MVTVYERAGGGYPVVQKLATEGVGVATSLVGGKFLGDMVEKAIVPSLTEASSSTDMLLAWLSNVAPKGVALYLLTKVNTGNEMVDDFVEGAGYGLVGSMVVDGYARVIHGGLPALILSSGNKAAEQRIQALLRENSNLKQTLQKVSSNINSNRPVNVQVERPVNVQIEKIEGPPNRPLEKRYEFTPGEGIPGVVYEKRPLEKQYEFAGGKSVTSKEILMSQFGFEV